MMKGKLRMVGIELSAGSDYSNAYVLGRIIGIMETVIIDEEIRHPLIIENPKHLGYYTIRLWATDEEWRKLAKILEKAIGTRMAKIEYYNIKSRSEEKGA